MAKKTAVRRLSKMLPLASEIMDQVSKDDEQFTGMRNVSRREMPQILPIAAPVTAASQEVEATVEEPETDLWEEEKP
jgi:recombinational DNA repair protein RecT